VVKEVFVQQKSKVLNITLNLQDSDNEKKIKFVKESRLPEAIKVITVCNIFGSEVQAE
jgi:hypothetical protein